MRRSLIAINAIAVLWLVFFPPAITVAADAERRRQLQGLEDAGVFDAQALRAHFPDAPSAEGQLDLLLALDDGYFRFFIWPAAFLATLNAVAMALFWKPGAIRTSKTRPMKTG